MNKLLFLMLTGSLILWFSMSALAEDSILYGCYKKRNGHLRIVKGSGDCKKSEVAIQWNVTGPEGPAGKDGTVGPAGKDGTVGPQGPSGADNSANNLKELCELYKLTGHETPSKCWNCGNGKVEPMEQCDDGNLADGDGCSSECLIVYDKWCCFFEKVGGPEVLFYRGTDCSGQELNDGDALHKGERFSVYYRETRECTVNPSPMEIRVCFDLHSLVQSAFNVSWVRMP